MEAPCRYSVSSLPSYCTVVRRSPSTMEMARAVWSWSRGRQRRSLKSRFAEGRKVDEIVRELDSLDINPGDIAKTPREGSESWARI